MRSRKHHAMKVKTLLLIVLGLTASGTAAGQNTTDATRGATPWNDLTVTGLHEERAHADRMPLPQTDATGRRHDYARRLPERWHFVYADRPELLDDSLTLPAHDMSRDARITVPGNMELQGFGTPVYVNTRNEFPSHPPHVPADYNPTGLYLQDFALPAEWAGAASSSTSAPQSPP